MPDFRPDHNWALFLDRDGVINERLPGEYVSRWEDFRFHDGALSSLEVFSRKFGRIFVVTNQQGIGKGLMTTQQLREVHTKMKLEVEMHGGRLDRIYFCPDLASTPSNCRKPAPALGLQAKMDFPDIEFRRSLMVGDSISDMEFGERLGMKTVLIETKREDLDKIKAGNVGPGIDYRFPDLTSMSRYFFG